MAMNKQTGFERWQSMRPDQLDARGDGFWVADDGDIWQLIGVYFADRSISPTGWAVRAMSVYADNSIVLDFPLERFAEELVFAATLQEAEVMAAKRLVPVAGRLSDSDDDIPF